MSKWFVSKRFAVGLVVGIFAIMAMTLYLARRVYDIAYEETKISQGAQQLEMARNAATGIEYYLKHLTSDLQMLASFPHMQYFESRIVHANVDYFFQHVNHDVIRSIFVIDRRMNLVYSNGDSLPPWSNPLFSDWLLDSPREDVMLSRVDSVARTNNLSAILAVPLIQTFRDRTHPSPSHELVGFVGYVVDFDWLMQEFIHPIRFGASGMAWLMDAEGRLLFHPHHSDMLMRSIYTRDAQCQSCHGNFDKQKALLASQEQYQEYQVAHNPAKMVAQSSVHIGDKTWHVVVSSDLSEVVGVVQKNFRLFFYLVGLALAATVGGGILLLIFNNRKVQAETRAQISEEKRVLQSQINQAAKLASIGELVDSVAHEINTPVGIIAAHVDALTLQHKEAPWIDGLNPIRDQTRRIAGYTRGLLKFSRRTKFNPEPTNVVEMAEECLTFLGHRLRRSGIQITKQWSEPLPEIVLDRNQMQQVLLNLLNNALDALDGRGEIRISIEEQNHNGVPGVRIEIADSGLGIKRENLPKIFDPFFTTKPPGKGTGLGLAISHAIVKRHGGKITAESCNGTGAVFTVSIPSQSNGQK